MSVSHDRGLLRRRLDALACDVGRLRRHLDVETYGGFLAGRVAEHVEMLDAILEPTAADRYRGNLAYGAIEEAAVSDALATVDARYAELHSLLGGKAP